MPEQTDNKGQKSGQQTLRCQECGKVLNSQEELKEHSKTHQGQRQQGGGSRIAGGGSS